MVEYRDRLPLENGTGKLEKCHVRPPPRAIDSEEAQPGYRKVIKAAIAVGHQLIALFGRGIEADRVIDRIIHAERNAGIQTVNAGAGGENQVSGPGMAAPLQNI